MHNPEKKIVSSSNEMFPERVEFRNELLEKISNKKEGLNIERARGFIESFGLRGDECLIYEESDLEQIAQIAASYGFPEEGFKNSQEMGLAIPEIGIVLIRREGALE